MMGLVVAAAWAQQAPDAFGRFDIGDVTVLRPVGLAFESGFDNVGSDDESPFDRAVVRALEGREADYDFAMVFIGQGLPRQIEGALAFNETHNRDVLGTGRSEVVDERFGVMSALYMNRTSVWGTLEPEQSQWVFNHEIGHHWLAFVRLDLPGAEGSSVLLGRQNAHWSYFLDTGNAPMEGNAWLDNGDGTFTTDPDAGPGPYSDLELYLMGLVPPGDVEPFFLVEPTDTAGRVPATGPDHWVRQPPTTIAGSRVEITVDDIIAANGPLMPGLVDAPPEYRFLTVLVVGPRENPDEGDLIRIGGLHVLWSAGFYQATRELASVRFDVADEGLAVPPIDEPAWIPEAAR